MGGEAESVSPCINVFIKVLDLKEGNNSMAVSGDTAGRSGSLGYANVASLWAFLALFDNKVYGLAFSQCFKTFRFSRAKMYENIFAAIARCNKTETFIFVEPFYVTRYLIRHM